MSLRHLLTNVFVDNQKGKSSFRILKRVITVKIFKNNSIHRKTCWNNFGKTNGLFQTEIQFFKYSTK